MRVSGYALCSSRRIGERHSERVLPKSARINTRLATTGYLLAGTFGNSPILTKGNLFSRPQGLVVRNMSTETEYVGRDSPAGFREELPLDIRMEVHTLRW